MYKVPSTIPDIEQVLNKCLELLFLTSWALSEISMSDCWVEII